MVVKPTAMMAWRGEGKKVAGPHCRFCRCRATCRTLAEYELEGVKEDFEASDLTEAEIANLVLRAGSIKKWLTEVEQYALEGALDGKTWPCLKLVAGRSVRKIADPEGAERALKAAGYESNVFLKPPELKPLTTLERLVGKKKLDGILKDVIIKPDGKPTLVSESDRREALKLSNIDDDFDDSLIH